MTEELHIGRPPTAADQPVMATPKRGKRGLVIAITAVTVLFVGAGAIAYGFLAPGTVTVTGSLELTDARTAKASCIGRGGYSDIHTGTQVIVTDATGSTLALGRLTDGELTSDLDVCRYEFKVTGIPGGHDFYGIEIGHRSRIQRSRDDIGKPIHLTLG